MEMPTWEPRETQFLVDHFETKSAGQIAIELGNKSRAAVCGMIWRLRGKGVLPPSGIAKHYDVDPFMNARHRRPKPESPAMPRTAKPKPPPKPRITIAIATRDAVVVKSDAPLFACTIYDLDSRTCRWPHWHDIADPVAFYCGATPLDGLPYCPFHSSLAYGRKDEIA